MPDQADQLRQLAGFAAPPHAAAPDDPPLVVVSGARAGVGATTVTLNLGAALADGGSRVLLVDAAEAPSDLLAAAGLEAPEETHAANRLAATTPDYFLLPGPAETRILRPRAGGDQSERTARLGQGRLLACLQSLRGETDVAVLDAGSGASAWQRRLWRRAHVVLVVTTPDDRAVLDGYATIKQAVAEQPRGVIRLLVNQCDDPAEVHAVCRRLSNACQRFLARAIEAAPSLPRHCDVDGSSAGSAAVPRAWESADSPFAHATLWLARAASDALYSAQAQPPAAGPRPNAFTDLQLAGAPIGNHGK
jgi:MinD-like ATPase involved in chromosome partitioning or flagellar assembly